MSNSRYAFRSYEPLSHEFRFSHTVENCPGHRIYCKPFEGIRGCSLCNKIWQIAVTKGKNDGEQQTTGM